ncbi:hypothetical protein [Streptomyces lonarensis]|uniref:Polymerase nucleotidyl transferase domain-containing protein n=1 Tax=Streptomyces lonarensis TaxID=700599 RepID=A0A7X6D368_9ACTN|nr:hypothetical protein [Streptomyces lonarensis]NJQ07353.1 hypothetical protein [Streptomyces lonarensis]
MKREHATLLIGEMLDRLEEQQWPVGLVTEVHLFGSYLRGALDVGDIDVVVQHITDTEWLRHVLSAMTSGSDGYVLLRQALRGRRRGFSFQFQQRDSLEAEGFELLLLWRAGEPVSLARERLAALVPDADAGPVERDFVLPAYEQLASSLPRPVRIDLHRLCTEERAHVTAIPLPSEEPRSVTATEHLKRRWIGHSPLRGAAAAALAHLENTGRPLGRTIVHGKPLAPGTSDSEQSCFIDLRWHYWSRMQRYFDDGQSWFEVLPATPRQPLHALLITPRSGRG